MGKTLWTWRRSATSMLTFSLLIPLLAACGGNAPAGGDTAATAPAAAAATTAPAAPEATAAAPAAGAATEAPTTAAAPAATDAGAAPTAAASTGGSTGGTLHILSAQAPTILNSHLASGTKDQNASRIISEPLAAWDEKGQPFAMLAAEIPTVENGGVSKDFTTITWKLKPGIKWSDGSAFTADDVVFTWQYCADEKTACTDSANFTPINKVEAVDPTTVKITWKEANPNYYISYVGFGGTILQKKQFQDCVGAAAATCPGNNAIIGTGPYKLQDFKPGDVVTYVKNENYRDAAKVAFDTVEVKGGGDAASSARAVCQTGEADYAWNLQVEAAVLNDIVTGGKCDLLKPSSGIERLLFNFANPDPALGDKRSEPDQPHPILSDIKVRQALALAIDKKTMAEQIYGQGGAPTCNILTQPPDIASPNTKCDQDVEKAKQLLDEAGWKVGSDGTTREKDGKKLELTFQTTINSVRQKEQALIKANWAAIGVVANLKSIDAGVFFSSDAGNPDTAGHFFADIEMYTNSNDSPDATSYFSGWTCAQIAQKSNNWQLSNNNRYCNKDYDAIIAQLGKETDPAKRKELFIKANDTLINDVVVVPLIDRTTPEGKSKDLQGPTGNTFDTNFWNIAVWHK